LALAHFFERGRWGSLADTNIEGQSLTAEDHLFVLSQAGLQLIHVQGMFAPREQRTAATCAKPMPLIKITHGERCANGIRFTFSEERPAARVRAHLGR